MRYWVLFSLFLIGCANEDHKCGNKFLVLWPVASGDYRLQEVTLSTLNSPYEMRGAAAKVYFENNLTANGYDGSVAQPQFTQSGDTCVPLNAESSMAVSVYAQFERLYQFEQKLGTVDMLSWPRTVGLDIALAPKNGLTHNNAHYFSEGDSIAVLPYSIGEGLPLGLNHGVLAHELFHGHFQRQVMNEMNSVLSASPLEFLFYPFTGPRPAEELEDNLDSPRVLNNFVLRAVNEGLADLYGALFTQNPEFFSDSLPQLKDARSLDLPASQMADGLTILRKGKLARDPEELVKLSYVQGTFLARTMYAVSKAGGEDPHLFLARVLKRLKDIPPAISAKYKREVLGMDFVVPILLKDFPLNSRVCAVLGEGLNKDTMLRSFQQCRTL